MTKAKLVHVVGGGLAGSEAAWQIANAGVPVLLHEMRPERKTDAHHTDGLAELVCSNSFRSDDHESNAVGLLHEEMRRCGSLIMACADKAQVQHMVGVLLRLKEKLAEDAADALAVALCHQHTQQTATRMQALQKR